MKTFREYISILEGGNAVEGVNKIPASISPSIYKEIEGKIKKEFPDVEMEVLGSVGKKKDEDTNGDIDIAIKVADKAELKEIIQKVFPDYSVNYNTGPNIISIGYDYDMKGMSGKAQVDFMIVKNINWAKFRFHSPNFKNDESKHKGAVRTVFLSIIISEMPVEGVKNEFFDDGVTLKRKWKYTFNETGVFKQLVDFTGKNGKPVKNGKKLKEFEEFISENPEEVAKFVFGEKGTVKDCNSFESLVRAIHDPGKFKYQDKVKTIEQRILDEHPEFNLTKADFR